MLDFSTYTRVPGSVSIQKLRTVPLGTGSFYGSTGKSHNWVVRTMMMVRQWRQRWSGGGGGGGGSGGAAVAAAVVVGTHC